MDGDSPSETSPSSPVFDASAPAPPKKKKSRGARLSKAEREARREAREAAAVEDTAGGSDTFEVRRTRLQLLVSRSEWDEAASLGCESLPLARDLVRALVKLNRHKLLTHCAARAARTLPVEALAELVQEALDEGRLAAAVALARGLGVLERFDFAEHALIAYETGATQEAADALGSEPQLQLRTLHAMLATSRCLQFAVQYLPALRQLPVPDMPTLERVGEEALAAAAAAAAASTTSAQGSASASSTASACSTAPAASIGLAAEARGRLEAALRARWPDCSVHLFGSRAVGLASAGSDVDACVLLPSMPLAHCRDAAGRALVRPLLPLAAECVRACAEVSGLHLVLTGRTPLLRFEFDGSGGRCASVELCVNNTDGLANSAVMRELLGADTAGTSQPLPALAAAVRRWAQQRLLCSLPSTLNSYAWTLLAASTLQQLGDLPVVAGSSAEFAAQLSPPVLAEADVAMDDGSGHAGAAGAREGADASIDHASDRADMYTERERAWRAMAAASLAPNGDAPRGMADTLLDGIRAASLAGASPSASSSPLAPSTLPQPSLAAPRPSAPLPIPPSQPPASTLAAPTSTLAAPASTLAAPASASAQRAGAIGLWVYHFFLLWGYDFAYRRRVVSLRQPHTLTKLDKSSADAAWPRRRDEQALMLEDPIETQRDLGRLVGKPALQAIRLEAAWAAIRLSGGASLEQLCEPFDWRLRPYASLLGHERLAPLWALRALGGAPPLYVHDQRTCEAMLVSLPRARILGLDCEGEQLSRHGRLCLLQLSTDAGQIFIVDMLAPCAARLVDALRPSLESPQVLKVVHDCRNDADALWHQHRVRLRHVFDTQAAYAVLKRNRRAGGIGGAGSAGSAGSSRSIGGSDSNYAPNRSPESSDCVSLGSLVRRMLGHAAAAKGNISAQMSEEPSFWARRPLRPSQLRYAASDVAHLLPLHARLLLEMDFVAAGGRQKHRMACTATGAASAEGASMMCATASRGSAIVADEAMVAGSPSAAEAVAAESESLRAAVTVRSEAYLRVREQTYGVARAEDIQLHAVLPGLVTNVSRFGLFVQVGLTDCMLIASLIRCS